MEKQISQKDLQKLYLREIKSFGKKTVESRIDEKRNTEKDRKKKKSIFLCHSHLDKTIVNKIAVLFEKIDVNIYVDWMDKTLPEVTNRETANLIKNKIEHSHKFLFLATYYGLKSKWCNWELGLAYTLKKDNELAILPIQSNTGKWLGNEYLHLYPRMLFNDENLENVDINKVFINTDNEKLSLKEWLD